MDALYSAWTSSWCTSNNVHGSVKHFFDLLTISKTTPKHSFVFVFLPQGKHILQWAFYSPLNSCTIPGWSPLPSYTCDRVALDPWRKQGHITGLFSSSSSSSSDLLPPPCRVHRPCKQVFFLRGKMERGGGRKSMYVYHQRFNTFPLAGKAEVGP